MSRFYYNPDTEEQIEFEEEAKDIQAAHKKQAAKGFKPIIQMHHKEQGASWILEEEAPNATKQGWVTDPAALKEPRSEAEILKDLSDDRLSLIPESIRDFGIAAIDAANFGFVDEAEAAMVAGLAKLRGKGEYSEQYRHYADILNEVRSLREERSPAASLAGTVAGSFIGPVGVAAKAAGSSIRGNSVLGALHAAGLSKKDISDPDIVYDIALGAGGGALGAGVVKGVSKALSSAPAKRFLLKRMDIDTSAYDAELDEFMPLFKEQAERINSPLKEDYGDYIEYLGTRGIQSTPDTIKKDLDKFIKALPDPEADYMSWAESILFKDVIRKKIPIAQEKGILGPLGWKAKTFISDFSNTVNMIDNKYSGMTGLGPKLNDVVQAENKLTVDLAKNSINLRDLIDVTKKTKLDTSVLYDALETKNFNALTKDQKLVANAWADSFETMRKEVNKISGREVITKLDGYVPRYMTDVNTIRHRVRMALKDEFGTTAPSTPELLEHLGTKEAGELKDVLNFFGEVKTPTAAKETLDNIFSPGFSKQYTSTLRSAHQRAEAKELPDMLKETDVGKLYARWAANSYKQARMGPALTRIQDTAKALKYEDPVAYKRLTDFVGDMHGASRKGFSPSGIVEGAKDEWTKLWAGKADETGNKAYNILANFPDLLTNSVYRMYPYYLGARPDALIRNMTQPLLLTAPELASKSTARYATKVMANTYLSLPKNLANIRKFEKVLKEQGRIPEKFTGEMKEALRGGLESTLKDSTLKKSAKALEDFSLYFYAKTDTLNRLVTRKAGSIVAHDAIEGVGDALKFVDNLPSGWSRATKAALVKGDQAKATRLIEDYLLSATQFNYTKASMSEFGRFMGGVFTMFQKWPTSITGDILETMSRQDISTAVRLGRLGEKYLAPWLGLTGAALYIKEETRKNPRLRQSLGKDISTYAPLNSVTGILDGSFVRPAPVSLVEDMVKAGKKVAKGEARASDVIKPIAPILPLGVYARFMTLRLPEFFGEKGKEPYRILD